MTSLQIPLIRQYLDSRSMMPKAESQPHYHDEKVLMKTLLLGMMLVTLGAETIAIDSNDIAIRTFGMCFGGGILGMIVGISCFPPKGIQAMAQEIAGNLCAAIAFGPGVTFYTAARFSAEPDIYWFVATSAALGICGLSIVKACKSDFVAWVLIQSGLRKPPEFIPPVEPKKEQ